MKRFLSLLLTVCFCFLLCSCGNGGEWKKEEEVPAPAKATFDFLTTTLDGGAVSLADFSDSKVILINLWEPWCGPCVGEMPDLEELYEKYAKDGFLILGVFGNDTDENAEKTVAELGITYPILHFSQEFTVFETGYVPTSVFIDGEGNILSDEVIVGSQSGSDWEKLIKGFLK